MTTAMIPTVMLNNGVEMPALGLGVMLLEGTPDQTLVARIAENADLFDFELSGEEIAAIDALDTGVRGGPDPATITPESYAMEIPEA